MIALLMALSMVPAEAAEVDIAPSGAVVTVRPEEGERAVVIDTVTEEMVGIPELPESMWLVHPQAWKKAVALGERVRVLEALPDEQAGIIVTLEVDLANERALRSEIRLQLEAERTTTQVLKRSRTQWLVGGLVLGATAGATGVAIIVL